MLITSILVDCTFRNSLLLSFDYFRRIFPSVSVSMNQTCYACWNWPAEKNRQVLQHNIFNSQCSNRHSTKGLIQHEQGSITARTGLDNSTNRARKMHGSGTKSARFGLERISSWTRNWHDLGSKTAPAELETGTLYARKRHDLGSKLARKYPRAGLENKQFSHEKQRFHHFGFVKFCSNTRKNTIKLKIKQIKRWNLEYMISGIGALHSSRLV